MSTPVPSSAKTQLARAVRQRFLADANAAMLEIGEAVLERLTALMDEPASARDNQVRRDAWLAYKKCRDPWLNATARVWQECLDPPPPLVQPAAELEVAGLQLVGAEVVENKILASRMVLAVMEKVSAAFDDLKVRMRFLEGAEDLPSKDLLRPEVLVLLMVEQWANVGMPGDSWSMVNDVVQSLLRERLASAYANANHLLVQKGVLATIELSDRVRTQVRRSSSRPPGSGPARPDDGAPGQGFGNSRFGNTGFGHTGFGHTGFGHTGVGGETRNHPQGADYVPHYQPMPPVGPVPAYFDPEPAPEPRAGGGFFPARPGSAFAHAGQVTAPGAAPSFGGGTTPSGSTPFWRQGAGRQAAMAAPGYAAADETRMMTAGTPLMRAQGRAQGVIGQVHRLFVSQAGANFASAALAPTPALAAAIAPPTSGQAMAFADNGTQYQDYSPAGMARIAVDLREKSAELKKKAETKSEKATIEIVALMFQAILSEERIPPGIRVWFARLQMPVLRVALEDPDFFGTTTHPARQLIDRMGSCVMGFDATGVQGEAMEREVRRVVQVIEQYPETGKRVYQVVYEEFQKFLSKFLTEKDSAQKVVGVAQQVEQKETLTIQYTIEMRNMLKDMPVRDEVRDFLFKVWAEVLAVAAVRKGPQHADTLTLKKSATDLVWAASAKPNRTDRARVIQELPNLLLRLRTGMTLLGLGPTEQEQHVKSISDTLADAFLSKTQAIPQIKIDAMAERLGHLEDFVSDDPMGDLPLDTESIGMMLGMEAASIEVIANGGSKPSAAMQAWAQELELGSWFTLDHNQQVSQVQFAWRSERKQLHLFATTSGNGYLIQAGRLAAYLQAGLLIPQEEESLTVRATRDAMAKLEANPERLFS
ncbi:MAG: DUF1631 domain-containing protein [Rhodoferax sp.]|nr:DUF1631 domain-containing protein [Rhodoferax sp.]MCF8208044.1 DUF1631 domain-containing protein [Rhodoferax sp.]